MRPYAKEFVEQMSLYFDIYTFTASLSEVHLKYLFKLILKKNSMLKKCANFWIQRKKLLKKVFTEKTALFQTGFLLKICENLNLI